MDKFYVLDASAVMALLKNEIGGELVAKVLPLSIVSTVNLTEVSAKFIEYGMPPDVVEHTLAGFVDISTSFDVPQALQAGFLRSATRSRGMSIGDRACLALAKSTGRIALTADRAWADLDVGVAIELIR